MGTKRNDRTRARLCWWKVYEVIGVDILFLLELHLQTRLTGKHLRMRTLVISLCLAALLCFTTADRVRRQGRGTPRKCLKPFEVGPCRARLQKWYYDRRSRSCTTFFWGGCKGNKNRFETKEQCNRVCRVQSTSTTSQTNSGPRCQQPKKIGHCRAAFPRYFFNSATKKCERFTYGGCGGNANNFRSETACRNACIPR